MRDASRTYKTDDFQEKSFRNALEINPNMAEAHAYYSHLLMILDRPVEMKMHMGLCKKAKMAELTGLRRFV